MKTISLHKIMALALLILLLSYLSAFAAERGGIRTQGKVKGLQLKRSMMILNEADFVWDSKTLFYDQKGSPLRDKNGSPAKAEVLKNRDWVYIVGVRQKNKPTLIQKLYLLPEYVKESEKHLYPFMQ